MGKLVNKGIKLKRSMQRQLDRLHVHHLWRLLLGEPSALGLWQLAEAGDGGGHKLLEGGLVLRGVLEQLPRRAREAVELLDRRYRAPLALDLQPLLHPHEHE